MRRNGPPRKPRAAECAKRGITRRLFLYIILTVLGISGLILLANSLLLRPLYYYSQKTSMLQTIDSVSKIDYTAEADVWTDELNSLTAGQPYDIVITNGAQVLYSSSVEFGLRPRPDNSDNNGDTGSESSPNQGTDAPSGQGGLFPLPGQNEQRHFDIKSTEGLEQISDGVYFGSFVGMSGIDMLACTKELSDGTFILLTQPAEPLNQSIVQANILLALCTLLALGIAAVFAFKVSKRFTKPIRQINDAVGSIAALDFSKKCSINTRDELQSLGDDVNRLSDELEGALLELKKQNEQLEKDIAVQRQFISNASHELRTPLSLIKGYADEINNGFVKEQPQEQFYIEIIAEEAGKMSRLLKEMLELTRMESGRAVLQNEKLLVSECVRNFIEKYDGFIIEKKLHVSLELKDSTSGLFDPMRFEQVLANYISNAARYGDGEKRVVISTEENESSIRISVFNTGKNIPEEIMEAIWDGFYKADAARTRADDSYGLGLSIVKAIQNAAGQGYGVSNTEDGVVFWFEVARYQNGK